MNYIFNNRGELLLKSKSLVSIKGHKTIKLNLIQLDIDKLEQGCIYINGQIQETKKYILYIKGKKLEAIKLQKKEDINKLATLSDQLNLLATTLDVVIGRVENIDPTLSVDPTIVNSRKILSGIQAILIK